MRTERVVTKNRDEESTSKILILVGLIPGFRSLVMAISSDLIGIKRLRQFIQKVIGIEWLTVERFSTRLLNP